MSHQKKHLQTCHTTKVRTSYCKVTTEPKELENVCGGGSGSPPQDPTICDLQKMCYFTASPFTHIS